MSRKVLIVLSILILGAACSSGGGSKLDKSIGEGKALVRVGGEEIHEGYLNLLQRVNPGLKAQLEIPSGKKRLVDNLVEQELFYQESQKRGLEKDPVVQEKVDLYRRVIVAQSLLDDEVDKKAKDYYDKNKEKEFERVKVAHIFFSAMPKLPPPTPGKAPTPPTEADKKKAEDAAEAKAKEAYGRLNQGDPWEVVVKDMSDDKATAPRGGEMGYLTRGDRRAERLEYQGLIDAAFTLPKGKYSEPIKAKDGWHIVQVLEDKEIQPYDDVAMSIKFKVRGETKAALVADLKQKTKVEYLDASLAESPPSLPMGPGALPPGLEMKTAPQAQPAETKPAGMKPAEATPSETKPIK